MSENEKVIVCSFCDKSQELVAQLIRRDNEMPNSPTICNECVDQCRNIIGAARLGFYKVANKDGQ